MEELGSGGMCYWSPQMESAPPNHKRLRRRWEPASPALVPIKAPGRSDSLKLWALGPHPLWPGQTQELDLLLASEFTRGPPGFLPSASAFWGPRRVRR